jgi:hypothetical protein
LNSAFWLTTPVTSQTRVANLNKNIKMLKQLKLYTILILVHLLLLLVLLLELRQR